AFVAVQQHQRHADGVAGQVFQLHVATGAHACIQGGSDVAANFVHQCLDQVVLAIKILVQRTNADPGNLGDQRRGGAVQAVAGDADSGGVHQAGHQLAGALLLRAFAHGGVPAAVGVSAGKAERELNANKV